jgi:predicted PurR-regulated permease PerM
MRERWPRAWRQRAVLVTVVALLLVLWLDVFAALFGALAGYVLYGLVMSASNERRTPRQRVWNALLAAGIVAGSAFALIEGFHLLLNASNGGLPKLMQLIADTLDDIRSMSPDWLALRLPESAEALQHALSNWLRGHARDMQHLGHVILRLFAHLILGLIIGITAWISMNRETATRPAPVLAIERWRELALAFADVLSAQLRIALVNAALTAAYLLVVLPALDVHVPLAVTLVAFTFFASMLPIVGNLLSNTAIIVAGLTVSLWVGVASFGFLVAIHKLEYFLNAHFVGSRIDMPIYALLASMLVLEAAFGMTGLIAAPIYCAWLTRELRTNRWIGRTAPTGGSA